MTSSFEQGQLKKLVSFLLVSVFVLMLAGLYAPHVISPTVFAQEPLETITLQLKWQHQFQFAGYYAALEQGFYRQAGFDVEIIESLDAEEPSEKVLAGEADFGIAMSDLVLLRSKGQPVVALATIYQHSPLVFLTPKSTGIDSVHDLVGSRVMLEAHSAELIAYLESEGISASQLIVYPHTFDTTDLIESKVDAMSAYSTDEPFELRDLGMAYSTFSPRSGGIDFYGDTLFTTEEYIREHPERVRAFLDATIRGWDYALKNQEETIDLILDKYSQRHSREHLEFEAEMSERLILADVVEIGYMNPGRWRNIADTYADLHMMPRDFSLEGFIYDRNPKPDLTWFYLGLGGAILFVGLASIVSVRFFNLNANLNRQIQERKKIEEERETLITELQNSLSEIKTLRGIIPICASCKNIRDDEGYWHDVATYLHDHSEAEFSHGVCPECMSKLYPDFYKG